MAVPNELLLTTSKIDKGLDVNDNYTKNSEQIIGIARAYRKLTTNNRISHGLKQKIKYNIGNPFEKFYHTKINGKRQPEYDIFIGNELKPNFKNNTEKIRLFLNKDRRYKRF